MAINNIKQFNQGIDQYKMLSSTSGVGSLVATRMGTFIMPLAIDEWSFIDRANKAIKGLKDGGADPSATVVEGHSVNVIEDTRFVNYLSKAKGLENLEHLIAIPHLQLDKLNYMKVKENPLYKKYHSKDSEASHQETFSIPAIIFPRWLYSEKTHKLGEMKIWQDYWRATTGARTLNNFAPPKDADNKTTHTKRDGTTYDEYGNLKQMPLVLICPKGHISDIPWETFFRASLDPAVSLKLYQKGFDFEDYALHSAGCDCGGSHDLTYTESKNKSAGWGVLKCTKCNKVVSLDGIMNLQPKCMRHMPWLGVTGGAIAKDPYACKEDGTNQHSTMRVALLTSSGVYYADQLSSLYIKPSKGGLVLTDSQTKLYSKVEELFQEELKNDPDTAREDFWKDNKAALPLIGKMIKITTVTSDDIDAVESVFLGDNSNTDKSDPEHYRFEEYQILTQNSSLDIPKLKFADIKLDSYLSKYFKKISQVETLCITRTQLNFFRCELPQVKLVNGSIVQPTGMNLFGCRNNEVYAYPAKQDFGEGLFFEFNPERLLEFAAYFKNKNDNRYGRRDYKLCSQLSTMLEKYRNEDKFYLLHTFAHILIKELEFSCGYPSASLAERIYFSDRMCGVLIYTTDGSEGSMGGLVWQGKPDLIKRTIQNALERAEICSSDPICWENNEESMNLAACFSCCMISETSCEYRNSGLDRKALVHDSYGYFK